MNNDIPPIAPSRNDYQVETTTPLVSVVLPVYNRADCIQRSIESVLRQTHQNLEVIVIDDGSTDRTLEQIKALTDHRIRLIALPSNKGANTARNIGIGAATGDWIAFQDSDDEWNPDKLAKQISACLAQQTSVAFCGMNRHLNGSIQFVPKRKYRIQPFTANRLKELLGASFISNQTLLVHRRVFSTVGGYDASLRRLQDWELLIRIARMFPITYLNEPLVDAYVLSDSITSNESICKAMQNIIDKHSQLFESERISLGIQLLSLSSHYISDGQYSRASRCVLVAIRRCRFQLIPAAYQLIRRR